MELPPGLACHLAAFLALRGDWVPRDELVPLLWPEAAASRGRHNLSQLLYSWRRTSWGHDVEAAPQRLRWSPGTDVADFARALADEDWDAALALYRGALLQAAGPAPSSAFQDWLDSERDHLHAGWRRAVLERAGQLERADRPAEAIPLLQRLLGNDDLMEAAAQALIRCQLMLGQRLAALRTFRLLRQRLREELGLEPLPSTQLLIDAVYDPRGAA